MKILFMGTPEFAATILQKLIESTHTVVAVVTQPDKPKGRNRTLTAPPVKDVARQADIPVLQPPSIRAEECVALLGAYQADVFVVAAYGKILPKEVLELPPYGCINLHGSLLPKYRGAAPVQRAIMNGEQETGVTVMQMDQGLDTGDMLWKKKLSIGENERASELFPRLATLGAQALLEALALIQKGEVVPVKQGDENATYAAILQKQDGAINFAGTARQVHNQVRGLYPWPTAYTFYQGKMLKVLESRVVAQQGIPGILLDSKRLIVGCKESAIELLEVQLAGSKAVSGTDFINGRRLKVGVCFGKE